jgi:hypothetical protein
MIGARALMAHPSSSSARLRSTNNIKFGCLLRSSIASFNDIAQNSTATEKRGYRD